MNQKIKPVGDRIIVKVEKEDAETVSGIIIPESARDISSTAVAEQVGHTVKRVKEGDRVLYNRNAGVDYNVDGVEYRIIRESDCEAVL